VIFGGIIAIILILRRDKSKGEKATVSGEGPEIMGNDNTHEMGGRAVEWAAKDVVVVGDKAMVHEMVAKREDPETGIGVHEMVAETPRYEMGGDAKGYGHH
jgi:hypothetical protein